MENLQIKGFAESSFLDWDGKIVSTIHFPDCNFRCHFCHNAGLVNNPDQYETISHAHVLNFLIDRKDFIDGVCITGGEPTLHKDKGLIKFIEKIKSLGFLVKLDTNGSDPDCLLYLYRKKIT